ncbi:MAG TPA: serine/threonine protein kinase [Gemmatimonas aurantiaca]|uniref:non-specific serine/threonine protein kinase n=2 Tax=Gemmatimonas aurantiaca TaxID=173480 RepID=C1AC70_GEMAT|nr:serine/threonine-protein kinase [Gemmatimonas aurantiaca]BAH40097.1 putative serine/threonine protein kinase [Gemmatimonas aurantiaca T-27]HCT57895.1 serine/threonine protein kinase [Gemmatimonas aurantiaca]
MNTDAMQWPEPAPSLARAVAAEFRLLSEIGRGGMGVVYLAEDTRLLRRVAIKTLLPHMASDAQVRERFVRESRTAAGLSHPGIVPIFSAADQHGVVYFIMGYVHGESLADRLARSGPLPAREALLVTRQVADALAFAHAAGVVHRDIKAENVLIDQSGRAVITDFGIARMGDAQPLTATGTVLGSVFYMSPEQVTAEALDGRSDLYALGVLLYHLLTGRFPYERSQASAVLVAHVTSPVPSLRDVLPDASSALDALVQRLLAKSPDQRTPSAGALLEQIDDVLHDRTPANLAVLAPRVPAAGVVASDRTAVAAVVVPPAVVPASRTTPTPSDAALSSAEAHQVWERAAALQAHTGVIVPPPEFLLRTPADGEPLTRGYDVVVVKEAALEAGIDAKYVERALLERADAHSLALADREAVTLQVGESQQRPPSIWMGAHNKLEFEATLDGEVPLDYFEEMVDEARRAVGEMVNVSVVGRTLTITTGGTRQRQGNVARELQIQVAVRNGRTIIRAFEDLSPTWGGLFGGVGFGAGLGLSPLVFGLTLKFAHDPVMAAVGAVTAFLSAHGLARAIFVHTSRKREQTLRDLVQRLARQARAELAQQKKLRP